MSDHASLVGGRISWTQRRAVRREALIWGVSGGAGLVAVYVGVLALANSTEHALGEFRRLWYWMVPLIVGFALQIGLFGYARAATRGGTIAPAHSSGDISFRLTPRRSDGRLILDIQADTHSGDLSELNLKDLVVLRADDRSYRPVESASLTGHHAQGMVTFDVPGSIERFSITIAGVRGMSELTFDWP